MTTLGTTQALRRTELRRMSLRPLLLVIAVLGAGASLFAQQDSLIRVWQDEARPDSSRMRAAGEALRTLIYADPDSALSLAMALQELATARRDLQRQAFALNFKGMAYVLTGNHYAAVLAYREMLGIYTDLKDQRGIAGAHSNLGAVFHQQGDLLRALEHYERCIPVFEALNDRRGRSITMNNLSGIHREVGDTARARKLMEELLALAEASGDTAGAAGALGNLGLLAQDRGDLPGALSLYRRSLQSRLRLNDRAGKAMMQHDIGEVHRLLGRTDSARHWLNASLALRDSLGDEPGRAQVLISLGLLALDQGNALEARTRCEAAASAAVDLQLRSVEEKACSCLVKACGRANDKEGQVRAEQRLAALNDSLARKQAQAVLDRMEFRQRMVEDSLRNVGVAEAGATGGSSGMPNGLMLGGALVAAVAGLVWWRRGRRQA